MFELPYARHVRCLLDVLKEQWKEPTEEQISDGNTRTDGDSKMITEVESRAKENKKDTMTGTPEKGILK